MSELCFRIIIWFNGYSLLREPLEREIICGFCFCQTLNTEYKNNMMSDEMVCEGNCAINNFA